jgi:putative resolvase
VQGPKDGSIPISLNFSYFTVIATPGKDQWTLETTSQADGRNRGRGWFCVSWNCSPGGECMKLRAFAQQADVRYETAWRWFKAGKIKGRQLGSGTIIFTEELEHQSRPEPVFVVYAIVSANENRPNLDSQAFCLTAYCAAKGWKVSKVVKEVGSGVKDGCKKLLALLADPTVTIIVVEHKDRLTRFGFKYIETLLAMQGRSIEVVNITENPIEDLKADLVSIIYSFSARLYGQLRAKRKTEQIVKELEAQAQTTATEKGGEKDAAS